MKPTPWFPGLFSAAVVFGWAGETTPLRIEQTVEPQFPAALIRTRITRGEARVLINVDADGKLADWLVTGYTDRAFADEAVDVLQQWRYTPATQNGQPVGIRLELRFDFEARGRVVSLLAIEAVDALFSPSGAAPFTTRVCQPRELDQPIAPVAPASPLYPAGAVPSARSRSVLLDFYVDERGQPRMPVVIDSPHENFSLAAIDALNRWRFTAPTRAGRPVAVRVRQEFVFPAGS